MEIKKIKKIIKIKRKKKDLESNGRLLSCIYTDRIPSS